MPASVARVRRQRAFGLLLALTAGGAVQGLYVLLFTPVAVFWWYFVTLLPAGLLGLAVIVDAVIHTRVVQARPHAAAVVIAATSAIVLLAPMGVSLTRKSFDGRYLAGSGWRVEAERAGEWAARNLPAGAMLSMVDSGAFGYYTPQELMNLDGVISSYDFHEVVCLGRLDEELRDTDVRYLAAHGLDPAYTKTSRFVPCWPDGPTTELEFRRSQEVYRSRPDVHGGRAVVFVIWRLPRTD